MGLEDPAFWRAGAVSTIAVMSIVLIMLTIGRFPHIDDSLPLAEASQRDGIMLAPGAVFRPHLERSSWMRFNVAVCEDPRVQRWLQRLASFTG